MWGGRRRWGGGLAVGVDIFHERDDIMLPIRLPQEQGYASFSSFYISAGFHIFPALASVGSSLHLIIFLC